MSISRRVASLLVAGFAAGLVPGVLAGQGVTVTSTSSMKASGALGFVVRMAGGGSSTSTTYVAGHKLRMDSRDVSTIIDADAGRFTTVDNKKKTYSTMTFEEMSEAMQRAAEQGRAEAAKRPQEKPSDIEWSYDVKVDPTSEHQSIGGYEARRSFITITVTARDKTKANTGGPNQGALVAFIDEWRSTAAPNGAAMAEFQRAYVQKMKIEFGSQGRALQAAFSSDPRMKTAMEAAAKEMGKLKGVPLKTTTSFIVVPEGQSFSRQLALGGAEEQKGGAEEAQPKPKGGLFGRIKAAAAQAEQAGSKESGPATQGTIMSFGSEVQEIKSGVPADAFSVPAGYKEVKPDVNRMP